jgi:hypothetical protein
MGDEVVARYFNPSQGIGASMASAGVQGLTIVENVSMGEHQLATSSPSFTLVWADGGFGEACTPRICAKGPHSRPRVDIALASVPVRPHWQRV